METTRTIMITLVVVALVGFVSTPAYADFIEGPVKWSQPITVSGIPVDPRQPVAGIIDGVDRLSDCFLGVVRADDFTSDGRPIVAVRWWGSYIGEQIPRSDGNTGPFDISFHLSNGGTHPFSLPLDNPLELYTVSVVQEVWVGNDVAGDAVYRYDAYLPEPFLEEAGVEYFLDICKPTEDRWGWHGTTIQKQDFSALGASHSGPWVSMDYDLAFELIAIPEPATLGLLLLGGLALLRRRGR